MAESKGFFRTEKIFFILFVVMSAVGIIVNLPYCYDSIITYDSSYQYALMQHSWAEIWRLLPEDYSPPLYAVMLKSSCVMFGHTLKVMRYTNSIVIVGLMFLSMFPIRRAFGLKTAVVSAVFFICSDVNANLFSEIRPTYLAYFFMTGLSIYAYLAFFDEKRKYYICHAVFSVLAMYTHNVAMIGALGVYVTVLLFAVIKKDKKKFIRFFISGVCCAALYIPWLIVVFKQLGNVKKNYWTGANSGIDDLKKYLIYNIFYDYDPKAISVYAETTISLLIKIAFLIFLFRSLQLKRNMTAEDIKKSPLFSKEMRPTLMKGCFILLLLIVPVGIFEILTRTVYPFVAIRYYYIFTGVTIIILSSFTVRMEKKIVPWLIAGLMIANSVSTHQNNYKYLKDSQADSMIARIKEEHPDGNISFLHSHEWTLGIMMYYFPNAHHYVYDKTWMVLNDLSVFPYVPENIGELDNITEYTDDFYVFTAKFPNNEENISEFFEENDDRFHCSGAKGYVYHYVFPHNISVERVEVKDETAE